jgi:hypothetical protein
MSDLGTAFRGLPAPSAPAGSSPQAILKSFQRLFM